MIISHKYKFIFIKTAKTAGTSIEIFLSQHCGENDIVTPIYPQVSPHIARNYKGTWNPLMEIIEYSGHNIRQVINELMTFNRFYNHMPARLVRYRVSRKIWKNYFKFCVERNPWDKTLSHFYHIVGDRVDGITKLDEYMERRDFCINYPLYTDSDGKIMLDRVIKYEFLRDELYQIFRELGLPFNGKLGVRAKSHYRKDRTPYQDVFTKDQRIVIEKAFAKEICVHGYKY